MIIISKLSFFLIFTIIITTKSTIAQDDKQLNYTSTTSNNFQPSLFVVIGVLSFMFSLTFLLLMYAKLCYQQPNAIHINQSNSATMFDTHTRFSGLDIQVVESLPLFRFSSLNGLKQGLQCSVCLNEFQNVEVLRLLPKCKHGFHIGCIDQWLESHSSCPLCRQRVCVLDLNSSFGMSSRLSNLELFVERPMQLVESCGDDFHRVNHRILVSDVVFKNRWSDVCSSDLMFLNSEMLGIMSSDRISSSNMLGCCSGSSNSMDIKEEIGRRITSNTKTETGFDESRWVEMGNPKTRAMSEMTAISRFRDLKSMKNKVKQCLENSENEFSYEIVREDVKRRNKWFSIAKKTVQWFANRENQQQQQPSQGTGHMLAV
ncbi:hypothetical protein RND81_08G050100 [Saponaria officinalis]|uniref:RING-type E3 ubiquitin transferase n=1 Tax=Saponaria officinalis TaxID=3572 RepID=A0AAW1J2M3_SAPOF